jgi:hypothetical protein
MERRTIVLTAMLGLPLVACLATVILILVAANSDEQGTFQAGDATVLAALTDEYRLARGQGEAWTAEPRSIALHFTCYEECGGEVVTVSTPEPDRVAVIVEDNMVFDDSIKATKERYEFVRSVDSWEIEWVGWKQQCRRDDWTAIFQGRLGWHTQICP